MARIQMTFAAGVVHRPALILALIVAATGAGCTKPPAQPVQTAQSAQPVQPNGDALLAQRLLNASPYEIAADPKMLEFVRTTAQAAITSHCASCHGADLTGKPGVPNLVDDVWLWGVSPEDDQNDVAPVMAIQQTILYGIRNKNCEKGVSKDPYGVCPDTRNSEMPGFQATKVFTAAQVSDLTEYVIKLSGGQADAAAVARAKPHWKVCVECHKKDGSGFLPYGGPNLTDKESLYGADRATIHDVIANGRGGACPPFESVLDAPTIKALAVYIFKTGQEKMQN
jgi:cytochrome c oxidase cbb3-type subunit III